MFVHWETCYFSFWPYDLQWTEIMTYFCPFLFHFVLGFFFFSHRWISSSRNSSLTSSGQSFLNLSCYFQTVGESVDLLIGAVLRVVVVRAIGSVFYTVLKCIIVIPKKDICWNRRSPRHQVNLFMQFNVGFGGPVAILSKLRDCPYNQS